MNLYLVLGESTRLIKEHCSQSSSCDSLLRLCSHHTLQQQPQHRPGIITTEEYRDGRRKCPSDKVYEPKTNEQRDDVLAQDQRQMGKINNCRHSKTFKEEYQGFKEELGVGLSFVENLSQNSSSFGGETSINNNGQSLTFFFQHFRPFIEPSIFILSLFLRQDGKLTNRHTLPCKVGLINEHISLHQQTITCHLLTGLNDVSRYQLTTVNLNKTIIFLHSDQGQFLCYLGDLPVAIVEEDVVDSGGDKGEAQQHNGKSDQSFHEEGHTHDVLQDVEGTNQGIQHVVKVSRNVYLMFILPKYLSVFHLPFLRQSLFEVLAVEILFKIFLVIESKGDCTTVQDHIFQFFKFNEFLFILVNDSLYIGGILASLHVNMSGLAWFDLTVENLGSKPLNQSKRDQAYNCNDEEQSEENGFGVVDLEKFDGFDLDLTLKFKEFVFFVFQGRSQLNWINGLYHTFYYILYYIIRIEPNLMEPQKSESQQFKIILTVSKKALPCLLVMSNTTINIVNGQKSFTEIPLNDTIGLIEESKSNNIIKYVLYTYPRRKKTFRSEQRYIQNFTFQAEDSQQTTLMKETLISTISNRPFGNTLKLLIYFNPVSGSNSKKHLNAILAFIKMTNLEPVVVETKHRNHCREHLMTINPKEYCAVAIVSGDGLVHEFVNSQVEIPMTHVPAGSGNGFAKTQMTQANQLCKDQQSIFLVIKNRVFDFNLMKIELEKKQEPVYSFLGLEWAILANLDMQSEHLRFLGGLRFELYAAYLILKMKRFRGRISYSTTITQIPSFEADLKDNPDYIVMEDNFTHALFTMIPYISDKFKFAPLLKVEDKVIDMQVIKEQSGRKQLIKYFLKTQNGDHFDLQQQKPTKGMDFTHSMIKSFRIEPLDPQQPGIYGIDGEAYESQRLQASMSTKTIKSFI